MGCLVGWWLQPRALRAVFEMATYLRCYEGFDNNLRFHPGERNPQLLRCSILRGLICLSIVCSVGVVPLPGGTSNDTPLPSLSCVVLTALFRQIAQDFKADLRFQSSAFVVLQLALEVSAWCLHLPFLRAVVALLPAESGECTALVDVLARCVYTCVQAKLRRVMVVAQLLRRLRERTDPDLAPGTTAKVACALCFAQSTGRRAQAGGSCCCAGPDRAGRAGCHRAAQVPRRRLVVVCVKLCLTEHRKFFPTARSFATPLHCPDIVQHDQSSPTRAWHRERRFA